MDLTRLAPALAAALLLTGCPENPPPAITAASTPSPAAAPLPSAAPKAAGPATPASEVAAQLDSGGDFYLYLGTERWLKGLSDEIAAVRDLPGTAPKENREAYLRNFSLIISGLKESGLEDLTGVGASSVSVSEGLTRQKLFFHHAAGKGNGFLWTLLGPAPHPLDALGFLPGKTVLSSFTDIDPAQLLSLVHRAIGHLDQPALEQSYTQAMAQFSAATGMPVEEALRTLTGTAGFVLTLDPTVKVQVPIGAAPVSVPRPALALILPSKDDRIYQQLAKMAEANPGTVRTDEGDLHLRVSAEIAVTPELKIRPTLARWKEWLILASDESLVREIIEAKTTGHGYRSTLEFAKLSTALPTEGNGFQLATALFTQTMLAVQTETMKAQPGHDARQTALLQKIFSSTPGGSSFAVSSHLSNGWLSAGNTFRSSSVNPLGTFLGELISAALQYQPATPAASDTQPAQKSLSQARQLALACQMYAGDHEGKYPPSLKDLVPQYVPDASILKSPLAPEDPEGYRYIPGLTESSPADALLLEDTHIPPNQPRVALRRDGAEVRP